MCGLLTTCALFSLQCSTRVLLVSRDEQSELGSSLGSLRQTPVDRAEGSFVCVVNLKLHNQCLAPIPKRTKIL